MTNENLINLTCKWLENNQSKYIRFMHVSGSTTPRTYVCGSCQTDLRAFLNFASTLDESYYIGGELYYDDVIKVYIVLYKKGN